MSIPNSARDSRTPSPEMLAIAQAQLEAERRQVAALSLFARRVSHDMSNFITVVRTYAELVLTDVPPSSATHHDVLEIQRSADAMIEYLRKVAHFAQASTGRLNFVALDEVIAEVLREPAHATRVRGDLQSRVRVSVDRASLMEALREVIANANEASSFDELGAQLPVLLSSWTEVVEEPLLTGGIPIDVGTWAVVEISDSGAGFPETAGRSSLDPFVTTKSGVRGAGFGLALARGAVWRAGGQIVLTAASGAANDATTGGSVRLWLPAETGSPA